MSQIFFNRSVVEEAWRIVAPLIELTLNTGCTKRKDLAIVVTGTKRLHPRPDNVDFIDHCLLNERIVSDPEEWRMYGFDKIALAKAGESVRTGRPTAELAPHYLKEHDTVYWGSVVRDDIVVACSGVEPYYDEMFSGWIADAIKAISKKRFATYLAQNPNEAFVKL